MPRFTPADCPHCEYDRRFPGFEQGGWMQQDNNGPIVSCPMCNDDDKSPAEIIARRSSPMTEPTVQHTEPQREPISISDINERYQLDCNYGMNDDDS